MCPVGSPPGPTVPDTAGNCRSGKPVISSGTNPAPTSSHRLAACRERPVHTICSTYGQSTSAHSALRNNPPSAGRGRLADCNRYQKDLYQKASVSRPSDPSFIPPYAQQRLSARAFRVPPNATSVRWNCGGPAQNRVLHQQGTPSTRGQHLS